MSDKMPKHKRLYKDSPTLERGDDGSMAAVKPSQKKADAAQSDTDDNSDKGASIDPKSAARIQEIKDMHKRHTDEAKAVYGRHEKEDAKDLGAIEPDDGPIKDDEKK